MAAQLTPLSFGVETAATPNIVAKENSLFEIDRELDGLLDRIYDEIEEHGEASTEAMDAFTLFAKAMNMKIDRIGGYLGAMEARATHCKQEADRLVARAKPPG